VIVGNPARVAAPIPGSAGSVLRGGAESSDAPQLPA
jgi:hypothetical protein